MAMRGKGSIINIASVAGHIPLSRVVSYSASKASVLNLTLFLAREWAPKGVRVNSITPGFFPAEENRTLLFNDDGSPTARTKSILDHTPMGRFGEANELVGAALFLASTKASRMQKRIIVYRVEKVRPRSSSATSVWRIVKRMSGGDVATNPETTPLARTSTNVPPSVAPDCVMTSVSCTLSSTPRQFPARLRTITLMLLVSECLPSVTVHFTENDPVVLYTCRGI